MKLLNFQGDKLCFFFLTLALIYASSGRLSCTIKLFEEVTHLSLSASCVKCFPPESAADVSVKFDIERKYNKSDYRSVQICFSFSPFTLPPPSVSPVLCTWAACAAVPISDLLDRASQRSDMIHALSTMLTHDLVSDRALPTLPLTRRNMFNTFNVLHLEKKKGTKY